MGETCKPRRRNWWRRGNNIIEFTFLMPWYAFLFVGTYDFGFFCYSLISVHTVGRSGGDLLRHEFHHGHRLDNGVRICAESADQHAERECLRHRNHGIEFRPARGQRIVGNRSRQ